MITGHFGLAAGVKKFAPRLPLWLLFLATFWLDIIFTVFSMFGLESFAPMNPAQPAYGEVVINAHYTHSLLGALIISAFTGWLVSLRWKREGGLVIAAVVFSHWILDLLVHRPDLPILPGNFEYLPLLGFGLWEYPRASAALELILILVGASLYFYSALKISKSDKHRIAWTVSLVTAALLFLLFVVNIMGL